MKVSSKTYGPWVAILAGTGLLFLFFFRVLPYHLFHREQTQLFLFAADSLAEYFRHPAALSRLSGDFLTQLFYYEGGGPLVLSVVLLGWGMVVFRLLRPYLGRWTWIPAVLAVLWEAGRQCGLDYPLSGTLSLIGLGLVLLLCRNLLWRSLKVGIPLSVLVLAGGYYLFGCADGSSKWYGVPNLDREYKLALDSEMYFGDAAELSGDTVAVDLRAEVFGSGLQTDLVSIPDPAADPYSTVHTASAALRQKLPDTQMIALLDSDSLESRIQGAGENGIERYIVDNPALS